MIHLIDFLTFLIKKHFHEIFSILLKKYLNFLKPPKLSLKKDLIPATFTQIEKRKKQEEWICVGHKIISSETGHSPSV